MAVKDAYGNTSTCSFYIQYSSEATIFTAKGISYAKVFPYQQANDFQATDVEIHFPQGCFYDSVYFHYNQIPSQNTKVFTGVHEIHYDDHPVHNRFTISVKPHNFPENLRSKALMVRENSTGGKTSEGGQWQADKFSAQSRKFGKFYITIDTISPTIMPVNVHNNKDMSGSKFLRMRIRDDLAGIKSYTPTMNGQWILMEYDGKNELLTYEFDERTKPGNNTFELTVTDERDNVTTFKANLKR